MRPLGLPLSKTLPTTSAAHVLLPFLAEGGKTSTRLVGLVWRLAPCVAETHSLLVRHGGGLLDGLGEDGEAARYYERRGSGRGFGAPHWMDLQLHEDRTSRRRAHGTFGAVEVAHSSSPIADFFADMGFRDPAVSPTALRAGRAGERGNNPTV